MRCPAIGQAPQRTMAPIQPIISPSGTCTCMHSNFPRAVGPHEACSHSKQCAKRDWLARLLIFLDANGFVGSWSGGFIN